MELTIQNPHASAGLTLEVELICNTPEGKILANVLANSQDSRREWVKVENAHEGVALLCGNGPSLALTMPQLNLARINGGKVFALNGAAKFLADKEMLAHCQIIMDAQPGTLELVGPADEHLFASQVDPQLFEAKPDATLFHATYGDLLVDEQPEFPKQSRDYCLIGASTSVGVTALVLLFAMGYRHIICFGFDSSNSGEDSHALAQSLNDNDVYTLTEFRGKTYTSSLTMAQQAQTFIQKATRLKANGCRIEVLGSGLLPAMFNAKWTEAEKYEQLWTRQDYRRLAPGELVAKTFVDLARPQGTVIDFGCGTGRGALVIAAETKCNLMLVDFTENSRDPEARKLLFAKRDLTQPMHLSGDYGFCTDVMEHIQPEFVNSVIHNIFRCVGICFFQISLVDDSFGATIGQPLHLSVHSREWWYDLFDQLGYRVLWNRGQGDSALFLVSVD